MKRLKVKIKPEIKKHCWEQVNNYNFGQRKEHNGDKNKQFLGIVAQSVVMDFFGLGYVDGSLGCDGGVDLTYKGKTYDVKAMGRNVDVKDSYVNNFYKVQENYNVDGYIFCSINIIKKELTVCGWIKKDDMIKHRKLCKKGSDTYRDDGTSFPVKSDNYEIDNEHLHFVNCILDMKMQMISRWENK